jgi:hypothetical protein
MLYAVERYAVKGGYAVERDIRRRKGQVRNSRKKLPGGGRSWGQVSNSYLSRGRSDRSEERMEKGTSERGGSQNWTDPESGGVRRRESREDIEMEAG